MSDQLVNSVDSIYERIGFPTMRTTLGSICGITATGRDPFKSKLRSQLSSDETLERKVNDYWLNLLLGGQRLASIYPSIGIENLVQIDSFFTSAEKDQSEFSKKYPQILSESELLEADSDLHFCEYREDAQSGIKTAIFTNKAYFTSTEELDASKLNDDGKELKQQGAEILCKQRIVTQCFHTVKIDLERKLLISTVDMSKLPRSEAASQRGKINSFLRRELNISIGSAKNLFPAVDKLYQQADGRVSLLSFLTSDGNADTLKLPHKFSKKCIKLDNYHKAGEEATKVITKYRIGKLWDISYGEDMSIAVGLTLPGLRNMLDTTAPLHELITENCTNFQETMFVINKLLSALEA
ncbi:hypothetical protein [Grimontia hollisae]|uniref:hypothetical protein n=1 Tax=Grimontia hollisae TaxID=673 RepID=UPI00165EA2C2|nr:hypothetical protein [Grimontia hollisae]